MGQRKINLSIVLAGQNVGIGKAAEKSWQVIVLDYDLGFFEWSGEAI